MSQSNLSPDVRHRLWQCYSLLLSLAEEAEEEAVGNSDGQASTANEINQSTRSKLNGSGEVRQEEVIADGQMYPSSK